MNNQSQEIAQSNHNINMERSLEIGGKSSETSLYNASNLNIEQLEHFRQSS